MKAIKFSGISAPLPGGSYDVLELRKQLEGVGDDASDPKVHEKIAKAVDKAQNPVPVAYADEPVKLFSGSISVPDGHVLAEVEGLDGIKRTIAVPVEGDADEQDNGEKAKDGEEKPVGATDLEMRARAEAPQMAPVPEKAPADVAEAAKAAEGQAAAVANTQEVARSESTRRGASDKA